VVPAFSTLGAQAGADRQEPGYVERLARVAVQPASGTFVCFVVVSALIGYVGFESLGAGADSVRVFQITGTVGVLA